MLFLLAPFRLFLILFLGLTLLTSSPAQELHLKSKKVIKGPLASCPGGVAVKGQPIGWEKIDWVCLRIKGYRFLSRLSPEKTRHYVEAFEKYTKALAKTFKFKIRLRKNWVITVRIFRNKKNYDSYEMLTTGNSGRSAGYFHVDYEKRIEEVVVMDFPDDPKETFDTLLHEGTHLLLHLWGKAKEFDFPIWMDEGMAEYFGGSLYRPAVRSRKKVFTQGLIKPWRLLSIQNQIKQNKALPLKKLLLLRNADFNLPHYSQSWSLIHFFANYKKGAYTRRLFKFFQNLMRTVRKDDRMLELFEKTIKVKLVDLEKDWRNYVINLKPTTILDRLAMAEAYEWKGDGQRATVLLKEILTLDPDDYRAMTILARVKYKLREKEEAFKILARAATIQPDYPPLLKTSGFLCYDESRIPEAVGHLSKYLAIEPLDREALNYFIWSHVFTKPPHFNPAPAIAMGEKTMAYHDDVEFLCLMSKSYQLVKKHSLAIKCLVQAQEKEPKNPNLKDLLRAARAVAGTNR